jgi:hypothetical protein
VPSSSSSDLFSIFSFCANWWELTRQMS